MKKIGFLVMALTVCLLLCACGKSQAVKDVEKVIKAIGKVSLESEEAILKAERMYDYLTDSEKAKVENKGNLVEARYAYDTLFTEEIRMKAKSAFEKLTYVSKLYIFNAHGMDDAIRFGNNKNAWALDEDFCAEFAEAMPRINDIPAITVEEVKAGVKILYEQEGWNSDINADAIFCINLFNRIFARVRNYGPESQEEMKTAGAILLELSDKFKDEKYYPILKEYFDFVTTGHDFFLSPEKLEGNDLSVYQSEDARYQLEIKPLFTE